MAAGSRIWLIEALREVNEPINAAHPMIGWDVALQAELVKQLLLRHLPLAHHRVVLHLRRLNQDFTLAAMPTSTESVRSPL
ncbi:MAG TPA: hypothetical protein PK706_15115 [Xanthobacteraceae bacterium]|nr:hypothetical protein [Xanthobacteraceae bacterium]